MTADGEASPDAYRRTDPRGFLVKAATDLRQGVVSIVAAGVGSSSIGLGPLGVAGIVTLVIGINVLISYIRWRHLRYRVGADDIRVESGVLSREARSVPFDRIQDVSLSESLLARVFELVEVQFETGAGGGEELKLAYVSRAEGERLREVIRSRRGDHPSARGTRMAVEGEAPPLFAMDTKRVLMFGLFEFSLLVLAVLGAAAQQFNVLLPFDVADGDSWRAIFVDQGTRLQSLSVAGRVAAGLLALGSLVTIGIVSGIARTLLRDYGFRLEQTEKGFRRRRGLFTRTDVVMPIHRVQAAQITTGAIRRLFGWHGLSFVSLARDGEKQASHVVAPFAQMEEIAPIVALADIGLPDEGTPWRRSDGRMWLDRGAMTGIFLLSGAAVLGFTRFYLAALAMILIIVVMAPAQWLRWRRHRHALSGETLFVRSGMLSPRLVAAPLVKLQSVEIAQGPLARRRGYAEVRFGLAGGRLSISGLPVREAQQVRSAVLSRIAAVDFSELPR